MNQKNKVFCILCVLVLATASSSVALTLEEAIEMIEGVFDQLPAILYLKVNEQNTEELEILVKIFNHHPLAGYDFLLGTPGLVFLRAEQGDYFQEAQTIFMGFNKQPNVERDQVGILHVVLGPTNGYVGDGVLAKLFFEKAGFTTLTILKATLAGPENPPQEIPVFFEPRFVINENLRPVNVSARKTKANIIFGALKKLKKNKR